MATLQDLKMAENFAIFNNLQNAAQLSSLQNEKLILNFQSFWSVMRTQSSAKEAWHSSLSFLTDAEIAKLQWVWTSVSCTNTTISIHWHLNAHRAGRGKMALVIMEQISWSSYPRNLLTCATFSYCCAVWVNKICCCSRRPARRLKIVLSIRVWDAFRAMKLSNTVSLSYCIICKLNDTEPRPKG